MTSLQKILYSLKLDASWLMLDAIPVSERLRYIVEKYAALLSRRDHIRYLAAKPFRYDNRNTPATLQSYPREVLDLARWLGLSGPPTILDIGANVGQFAVTFASLVPQAKVYSIEPNPDIFSLLSHNVTGLPNIQVHNFALGPSGRLPFYYVPGSSALGGFIRENALRRCSGSQPEVVDVSQLTLDVETLNVHRLPDRYDLVKIDVEGFEYEVLDAMPAVHTRFLYVEYSASRNHSYTFPELLKRIKLLTGPLEILYCDKIDLKDSSRTMGNLLVCGKQERPRS
jgi:FkbM family methyltransferase